MLLTLECGVFSRLRQYPSQCPKSRSIATTPASYATQQLNAEQREIAEQREFAFHVSLLRDRRHARRPFASTSLDKRDGRTMLWLEASHGKGEGNCEPQVR